MNGGMPQGSILGVFLYNVSTDDLEEAAPDTGDVSNSSGTGWTEDEASRGTGSDDAGGMTSTPSQTAPGYVVDVDDSPIRGRPPVRSFRFMPTENNARRQRASVWRIVYS